MKTADFHLRATERQSIAWKRAADLAGYPSVGSWAADALDSHLKHQARQGKPLALHWRKGRFTVTLLDGSTVETWGVVSPPFAYYRGSAYGLNRLKARTLVSLSDGRIIASLRRARQCRELASELAVVWLRDEQAAASIIARHTREAS